MSDIKNDFAELTNNDEILSFLKVKGGNHNCYYHYTNLSSAVNIISSQSFWLTRGNSSSMNDQHECHFKGTDDIWDKTYLASFSFGDSENMAMWGLYCLPWEEAVRISIPKKEMKKWLDSIKVIYKVENNNLGFPRIQPTVKFEKTLADIVYIDGRKESKSSKLFWGNRTIKLDKTKTLENISSCPKMTGYIKNAAWKYENEVRINIKFAETIGCEKIAVAIPSEIIDAMEITTGPYFKGDITDYIRKNNLDNMLNIKVVKSGFKDLVNYRTLCSLCSSDFEKKK